MQVTTATPDDYLAIVDLWEASVRATHTFLPEEDIQMFRPLILDQYLDAVTLLCARTTDGAITGFLGVADNKVEMLFIDPALMGQGIGRLLLEFAVKDLGATLVDVNEQNPDAVGFYLHYGFELVSRDPLSKLDSTVERSEGHWRQSHFKPESREDPRRGRGQRQAALAQGKIPGPAAVGQRAEPDR